MIDPDEAVFLPPGDVPARVADACRRTGQPTPDTRAGIVRCILDSLALAHRRAILGAREQSGHGADTVHIVGGGARNELLCQLTADACGLPVVARDRPRRPRWATCSCRPGRSAWVPVTWTGCAG